jgi:hypothetical protein
MSSRSSKLLPAAAALWHSVAATAGSDCLILLLVLTMRKVASSKHTFRARHLARHVQHVMHACH